MGTLLIYLFIRGPLLFRILAWAVVAAIVFTAILLLFISPNGFPKGTVPHHVQHPHAHPARFVRS